VPPPVPKPAAPAAATSPGKGRLVVIGKDGNEGPSYPLADQVDIGRTEGNVVVHDDRYLSPRHARLVRRGDRLILRDLGSVNGIFLRLGKRSPARDAKDDGSSVDHPLEDQDLILVGQQVIRFEIVRDADDGLGIAVEQDTLVFGTPALPRFARLSVRTVEGVARDVFYIRKNETVLGRESGDIVFTEDPFLSRRHCVFRRDGKRCTLTDFGSSNGTFVKLRGEVDLKDGDQFRIGQQLFRLDLSRHA
jgi:pSer/pThr/pTyr-binding forkhead associated (FHA) protein